MKNILLINEKDIFHYFTASFSSLPALKAGTLEAICISSPVCGLRPVRATLSRTSNVPNPISCTFHQQTKVLVIDSTTVCTTTVASFEKSQHFVLRF